MQIDVRFPARTRLVLFFALVGILPLHARTIDAPESLRPDIEQLLESMAAAALAGDPEKYLKHICRADPVFETEQTNWAADLVEHTPEQLRFALRNDPAFVNEAGEAHAEIRIAWRMTGGHSGSVVYPARFTRCDESGWLYAGEQWETLEGDRIQVMYFGPFEPIARRALEASPDIRQQITSKMGLEGDDDFAAHVQQVKIYPTMDHLQKSIYLSYSDGLSGWNEPGESIKILASLGIGRHAISSVLAHEFGHVASFQYGPEATTMPWWILEGVAEFVAEPWARNGGTTDRTVRQWARTDNLRDWEVLADFRGEGMNHVRHVYRQGHHMLRFITDRFGAEARNTWMIAMANSATLDEATREAFDMTFEELDALWRESIGAPPRQEGMIEGQNAERCAT